MSDTKLDGWIGEHSPMDLVKNLRAENDRLRAENTVLTEANREWALNDAKGRSGWFVDEIRKLRAENAELKNWIDEKRGFVEVPHLMNCAAKLETGECDCFPDAVSGERCVHGVWAAGHCGDCSGDWKNSDRDTQ